MIEVRHLSIQKIFLKAMRPLATSIIIWLAGLQVKAADLVLHYDAFGPQSIAHELIGFQWWQWDSHGDSQPREYPIKVVVYWGQTLEETKLRFPVDRTRELDFRYVEYDVAVAYLKKAVRARASTRPTVQSKNILHPSLKPFVQAQKNGAPFLERR